MKQTQIHKQLKQAKINKGGGNVKSGCGVTMSCL